MTNIVRFVCKGRDLSHQLRASLAHVEQARSGLRGIVRETHELPSATALSITHAQLAILTHRRAGR